MNRLRTYALNRQIQILIGLGLAAGIGYYIYLKQRKDKADKAF